MLVVVYYRLLWVVSCGFDLVAFFFGFVWVVFCGFVWTAVGVCGM